MITISLCMIVRDEEAVLARCLDCIRDIADEIIIVDTGSSDRTREIAGRYGAKQYDYTWADDFAAARNAAFEKATMEYILWLDADDVIDEENQAAFLNFKKTLDSSIDVVMMRYHVAFDEHGKPTCTFYRERLLRREKNFKWMGRVHEAIVPEGNVIRRDIAIKHMKVKPGDAKRNLRIYERMIAQGEKLEPRHRYYYARELFYNGRDIEAIELLGECIADTDTWLENRVGACRDMAVCYMRLGNTDLALRALLESFMLGEPRAEVCCELGHIFFKQEKYPAAIFWYEAAPNCTPSEEGGGFASPECRGYIPCMQLCVCYDRIGRLDLAEMYNEKAASFKEDNAVKMNREYFRQVHAQQARARQ